MEAIKRQATKLREQVAKQQQALLRQLGHFDAEAIIADEAEIARHHQLQDLYTSTRAAKHFEKDIVHGIEGYISVSSKHLEIERRFAQDCCRYEAENQCSTSPLAEAALHVGASRNLMVKEEEALHGVLSEQVCKPLRALVKSAELEDARHLIRRYDRLWLDVEAQAGEVLRLRSKSSERTKSGDTSIKLELAEEKLDELKSRLMALGKEATSAMQSVEAQQQTMTFQKLVIMVNAERSFHHNVVTILDKLMAEMMEVEQSSESLPPPNAVHSYSDMLETVKNGDSNGNKEHGVETENYTPNAIHSHSDMLETGNKADSNGNKEHEVEHESATCFVAKVVHPFDAQGEGELSLSLDDTLVVQQVIPGGWSKGECNGKTGWFPSPYVEKLYEISAGKMTRTNQ